MAVQPPTFTPSCPLEVVIGGSPDNWYIHDTVVTAGIFSRRARTTRLSEQRLVLFSSKVWNFSVALARRGEESA